MLRTVVCSTAIAAMLPGVARAASSPEECRAWPGEPSPLPQIGSSDPFWEHWAALRRDELQGLAGLLEVVDPVEAQRVWRHAACLAPGDPEIAEAIVRTAARPVHRPAIAFSESATPARRTTLGAAFAALDAPVRVAGPAPAEGPGAASGLAEIDARIDAAAALVDQARFRQAIDLADLARARARRFRGEPGAREREVRIELVAATAKLALGEEAEARQCAERALRAQPSLELDALRHPAKLIRLVEQVRASAPREP